MRMPDVEDKQSVKVRPEGVVPDDLREKAALLFSQGVGYRAVARVLDLSENTVRDWRRYWRAGKFKPVLPRRNYLWPEETKAKVIKMRKEGASWKTVLRETGVSAATAQKWIRDAERRKEQSAEAKEGDA